jgi:hypothetical protein
MPVEDTFCGIFFFFLDSRQALKRGIFWGHMRISLSCKCSYVRGSPRVGSSLACKHWTTVEMAGSANALAFLQ